ncbi:Alg9-like mannosyltransferase family-domain-containing protein [Globomyces pollinis-pini]|nr:Alg9-like mannosyltransferase family-domain-containing protein [Globomyces pollinis-pini]
MLILKLTFCIQIILVIHLIIAPFTKVEESFNLQAVHDLLFKSWSDIQSFDHMEFPGVVPRTFIGPLMIYALVKPIQSILSYFSLTPDMTNLMFQYITRGSISFMFTLSHAALMYSILKAFGRATTKWFGILSFTQFHLMYWSSRPLPNVFALIIFQFALALWILPSNRYSFQPSLMMFLLIFNCAVFRAELFGLSFFMIFTNILNQQLTLPLTLIIGIVFSATSICSTMMIDSHFWQKPFMWPEFQVFIFNGVENRSVEWGVSPFYAYFTSFLPRIVPLSFALSPLSLLAIRKSYPYYFLLFIHIIPLSFIGHKEWRFIMYLVPIMNLAAAIGIVALLNRVKRYYSLIYPSTRLIVTIMPLLALFLSLNMLYISHFNYPGGNALQMFHTLDLGTHQCTVHIDSYTAMTGASRFGERNDGRCTYSKHEGHNDSNDYIRAGYMWLLTSNREAHNSTHWIELVNVKGYDGISLKNPKDWLKDLLWNLQSLNFGKVSLPYHIKLTPKVSILKRRET